MTPMRLLCGAFLALLTGLLLACKPAPQLDSELRAFAQTFREANQAKDIQPMRALYCLEGCDTPTIKRLERTLLHELGLPIQEIDFVPLSGAPEETIHFIHQGVHYGPTLEPRYRMRVRYDVEDAFTSVFAIGQTALGSWRIVSAKPIPKLPQEPVPSG